MIHSRTLPGPKQYSDRSALDNDVLALRHGHNALTALACGGDSGAGDSMDSAATAAGAASTAAAEFSADGKRSEPDANRDELKALAAELLADFDKRCAVVVKKMDAVFERSNRQLSAGPPAWLVALRQKKPVEAKSE